MSFLVLGVIALVVFGSVLALAEASISRMTAVRALALHQQGHRNAGVLERIEAEPARYLNGIYLSVMFAQNGSAILVALLAERQLGEVGITLASVAFTLVYFVIVEAMSKTFAILHSDRVALGLAPFVYLLGRALARPTRALIGLANLLLPGRGLEQGPFVAEQEIRSIVEIGHRDGTIEPYEREIIHSVFQFGDRTVRHVMAPQPDIVAADVSSALAAVAALIVQHGRTRIPVYRGDLDHAQGIVHAKDVLQLLHEGRRHVPLSEILRPVRFVPESTRLADLLREMQAEKFHLALVSDEYGSVVGLVTLEDLLEELVGRMSDEHDRETHDVTPLEDGRYRINAALPVAELNEVIGADLPHDRWNTVGGLVYGLAGAIPPAGTSVEFGGFRFTVDKVQRRRILTVVMSVVAGEAPGSRGPTDAGMAS